MTETDTLYRTLHEIDVDGELLELEAEQRRTWIEYRPATYFQPEEGGYWETDSVQVTSVLTEQSHRLKRSNTKNVFWWWRLDCIAFDEIEAEEESHQPFN